MTPQTGTSSAALITSDVSTAASQLADYLKDGASCGETIIFAKSGDAFVGLYAGPGVQKSGAADVVSEFQNQVAKGASLLQICDSNITAAGQAVGIIAGSVAQQGLASVQDAVQTWASAACVDSPAGATAMDKIDLRVLVSSVNSNSTLVSRIKNKRSLQKRTDCTEIQVISGDSCASLATRCGISGALFTEYNPSSTLCSTLVPDEWVCCSAGDLPDHAPQPQSDGTCYTYSVQSGDTCSALAGAYSITVDDIEDWNTDTWGFAGCSDLQIGQAICKYM